MHVLHVIQVTCLFLSCEASRILFFNQSPTVSHSLIYNPIIRELIHRGHEVVSITPEPINDATLVNLTEINVHDISYAIWNSHKYVTGNKGATGLKIAQVIQFMMITADILEGELQQPEVTQLINDRNAHFDVIIMEWLSYAGAAAFAHRFQSPFIGISSFGLFLNGNDDVGNPTHPLYHLDAWQLPVDRNSFMDRVASTMYSIIYRLAYRYIVQPEHDRIARKYFGNDIPYIGDLEKRVSLILQNTSPLFHQIGPKVPAVIEFGGIHWKEQKPLPKTLQKYLDESTQGCIYFSLGSNILSENLPQDKIQIMLDVFRDLPYNILWKIQPGSIQNIPPNVKIMKWLPQQDILDHKNVKLFITHGGLQSTEETIRSQVPVLVMPFFCDQFQNAQRFVHLGIGKRVILWELTAQQFKKSIEEIIGNKSYYDRMRSVSEVLWDTPMKPMDTVIWWIEYVIRHRGAEGLKSPTADIPWYQFFLLDVFVFFVLCTVLFLWVLFKLGQLCFRILPLSRKAKVE